jgi:hypothetical protein
MLQLVKQAAVDAVEERDPVMIMQGRIETVKPISIRVADSLLLTKKQLVGGFWSPKPIVGEHVILIREQGGQKFIVLGPVDMFYGEDGKVPEPIQVR